jgi:hypothetical protein
MGGKSAARQMLPAAAVFSAECGGQKGHAAFKLMVHCPYYFRIIAEWH